MDQSVNESNEVKVKTHYTGKVVKTSLAGALVRYWYWTPLHTYTYPKSCQPTPLNRSNGLRMSYK